MELQAQLSQRPPLPNFIPSCQALANIPKGVRYGCQPNN